MGLRKPAKQKKAAGEKRKGSFHQPDTHTRATKRLSHSLLLLLLLLLTFLGLHVRHIRCVVVSGETLVPTGLSESVGGWMD